MPVDGDGGLTRHHPGPEAVGAGLHDPASRSAGHGAPVFDAEILAARRRQAELFPAFDPASLSPAEARRRMNAAARHFNDGGPPVAAVSEVGIPGTAGTIAGRLYRPTTGPGLPAILFLHGGGWFSCNIDTHDRLARCLALESGAAVLSIDYRLAPEHPFPAALFDAIDAWHWLQAEAPALGLDPGHLTVAGDSAGANLALALCVAERDHRRPLPKAAALIYGCFAPVFGTASQTALGDGRVGLTTARMRWYWRSYIGPDLTDPPRLAAPSLAPLDGLPPVHLCFAELDPLADESRHLARAFDRVGIAHELRGWPGAGHGFLQLTRDAKIARDAAGEVARFLARF
jgi:acetyl esterase